MSLQVLYGCIECLHNMQGYLEIRDANSLHATCKYLRNQLMDLYFKDQLLMRPAATREGKMSIHHISSPVVSYKSPFLAAGGSHEGVLGAATNYDNSFYYKYIFIEIFKNFLNPDKLINLSNDIYSVSSVDRAEECPLNCLNTSKCYLNYTSQMKILAPRWSESEEFETLKYQIGIDSSYRCGCIMSSTCYWSSKPCPTDNAVEHITFSTKPRVSVAVGFSITPYQAFFQPETPTYSPAKVQLQFLKSKIAPVNPKVKIGGHTDTDADLEYVMSTEAFLVPNTFEEHVVLLQQPIILTSDTLVRIMMIGSQQRQTIQEANDDYYMCVSNFKLLGYDVSSIVGSARESIPQSGKNRQKPATEMDSDVYGNLVHLLGFKVVNMIHM